MSMLTLNGTLTNIFTRLPRPTPRRGRFGPFRECSSPG